MKPFDSVLICSRISKRFVVEQASIPVDPADLPKGDGKGGGGNLSRAQHPLLRDHVTDALQGSSFDKVCPAARGRGFA
ncbi:hypothetical protein CDAR_527651 [Caerostris darwini]|uniref:Uncharacterized protein n=1 Tax=Caerostris darwini TaxID=1538125 RepID=A0AAV4RDX0_9ARAC|nr:hypothetical protein CDAR_527651 [Caerostris darwini]